MTERDLERRAQRRHSPRATQMEVIEKIIWLRKHYHFGPGEDRDVSGPLPRHHHQYLRGVADPEAARDEPAARLPALPTAGAAVETLRKATPRPPAAGRRQIHRTPRPEGNAAQ